MSKPITLEELFGNLNARLFHIGSCIEYSHFIVIKQQVVEKVDFYSLIKEITKEVFKFPIDQTVNWLNLMLKKVNDINLLQPYPFDEMELRDPKSAWIDPGSEEYKIEHFKFCVEVEEELSTYYHELEAIRNQLLSDERGLQKQAQSSDVSPLMKSGGNNEEEKSLTKRHFIKSKAPVEGIAAFIKSIYKYYPDPSTKPIKDYKRTRDLHRAVVSSILPISEKEMSLESFEIKYNSNSLKQIQAAEKVHLIFLNCVKAVDNYIDDMIEAKGKKFENKNK